MDKPSNITPYIEEPNHDQMSNHVYPPQIHDIQAEMPPGGASYKIPINGMIGKESTSAYCYGCNDYCDTRIGKKVGSKIWCCFCILLVSFPILSPIPFCVSSCYDTGHYCPKCKKIIARYMPQI